MNGLAGFEQIRDALAKARLALRYANNKAEMFAWLEEYDGVGYQGQKLRSALVQFCDEFGLTDHEATVIIAEWFISRGHHG
jgi:hypothetical protein